MDVAGFIEMLKVASEDASLILAAAGFVLSIGAAIAASIGVWRASVANHKTQMARRATEEETHVLAIVKLATNYNESRDFYTQLAAITLLAHHPKYLDVMYELHDLWNERASTVTKQEDPTSTWRRMSTMMGRSIQRAEGRRSRWQGRPSSIRQRKG